MLNQPSLFSARVRSWSVFVEGVILTDRVVYVPSRTTVEWGPEANARRTTIARVARTFQYRRWVYGK